LLPRRTSRENQPLARERFTLKNGSVAFEADMYDTSDVVFSIKENKRRTEVTLVATSKTNFNLLKYCLALRDFVDKVERELNIMSDHDRMH
jgi:hypothetical protein